MTPLVKPIAALFAVALLAACGFQPMYGTDAAGNSLDDSLGRIAVAPIPYRLGQVVHNHLLDLVNPYGAPAAPDFVLNVVLEENTEGFGFRSDESITRETFTLTGAFQLVETASGKVVLEETVRSVHSYDIVQSDFANYSARQDARTRTAGDISNRIAIRLGFYLKSTSGSP